MGGRRPGTSRHVNQRNEPDALKIVSGAHEGLTTGTPVCLLNRNTDQRSRDYGHLLDAFREVVSAVVASGGSVRDRHVRSVMDDAPLTCTPAPPPVRHSAMSSGRAPPRPGRLAPHRDSGRSRLH